MKSSRARVFLSSTAVWCLGFFFLLSVPFAQALNPVTDLSIPKGVTLPSPSGFVNDFAGILTNEGKTYLNDTLKQFELETSNEITIVIVPSFQGMDRFTYSQALFSQWKIGKANKNNGILFLIGPKGDLPFPEHGEAFINVGKGLEGALPDSLTGSILRSEVFPKFQTKQYYEGVLGGVEGIISATKGEYTPSADQTTSGGGFKDFIFGSGFWLVWLFFIFVIHSASFFLGRTKSWWLGGALGGAGGLIGGFIFYAGLLILLPAVAFGVIGLIFDYVVSKNYDQRKKQGKPTDFWSSGGGFWFGGGGRGGFGGGGGFGGFGGGGSGGGGAGGGW